MKNTKNSKAYNLNRRRTSLSPIKILTLKNLFLLRGKKLFPVYDSPVFPNRRASTAVILLNLLSVNMQKNRTIKKIRAVAKNGIINCTILFGAEPI
ncbi:hypothetical protein ES705_43582 [subsurface metagenome]